MDFDPHSIKWQCCCCSLPSGMKLLASFEFAFCAITAGLTIYNVSHHISDITAFDICLISLMLFVALTSILLIVGIQKHSVQFIYPSLVARGFATLFLAVFGVSTVFSSNKSRREPKTTSTLSATPSTIDEPNMALRLVLFVFAMLFLTVIIFYVSYLVVRLIHYEKSVAKLKERRSSLIHAGMIDPDFPTPINLSGSRRTSFT